MQSTFRKAAGLCAAAGMLLATPAMAGDAVQAEKLRRLDIMLMVIGLRCRTTADNFTADFADFEAAHMATLNAAATQLRDGMVARFGMAGANRALDRLSTSMANQYGQGHPWLGCAELKMVARSLPRIEGEQALIEAADQLLEPNGAGVQLAWAR